MFLSRRLPFIYITIMNINIITNSFKLFKAFAKVPTYLEWSEEMTLTKPGALAEVESELLEAIVRAIAFVQQQTGYGSIEITIHDGRVTQIERREKVRFESKPIPLKR